MSSLNALWARAVVQELVRGGVGHAVIAPGSRSAPLALACAEASPLLRVHSVIDERTAGFFALGLALESGRPTAVVVTSGTAGAHLLPAVMEAWAAHVPLLVLTANRPWELHGFGAAQTAPQDGLFGRFALVAASLGLAEASTTAFLHLRAVVARAVSASQTAPRGPVHLDAPFREPLVPEPSGPEVVGLEPLALHGRDGPFLSSPVPRRLPPEAVLADVRRRLAGTEKGLVVVGPLAEGEGVAAAVLALADSYGYPVLADAASNLRGRGPGAVVGHADVLLRSSALATSLRPDFVLRLGGGLTSKRLSQWLDASGAETVLLSETDAVVDAAHRARLVLVGDLLASCTALTASARPQRSVWAEAFSSAEARAEEALRAAFSRPGPLTEPQLAHQVVASLPDGARLVVASSMPIRDVESFASSSASRLRVLSNRGLNGIDGTLSTALGVAAASGQPTVVLLGDLAFLHDLGGLLIARRNAIPLTVVVANNDGGGIFSFLPVAGVGKPFETLFATPHGVDFEHAGQLFGARTVRVETAAELSTAMKEALRGGLHLVEARLPGRSANVALHQTLGEAVAKAAEGNQ